MSFSRIFILPTLVPSVRALTAIVLLTLVLASVGYAFEEKERQVGREAPFMRGDLCFDSEVGDFARWDSSQVERWLPVSPMDRLSEAKESVYLQRGGEDGAEMMITIASDISLGTWSGTGGVTGTSAICIYHSGGSGYAITLTATSNFRVVNGESYVAYTPSFSDSGVGGTYTTLSYGITQSFSGADTSSSSCSGSYNAALKIEVDEADLSSAQPGSYSATLTLVLTPS